VWVKEADPFSVLNAVLLLSPSNIIALLKDGGIMKKLLCFAACLLFVAPNLNAVPLVLEMSSVADLNNIAIGDTVTIDISLDGMDLGDTVDVLSATVIFEAGDFSTPIVSQREIVPDPLGFESLEAPGIADGFYDALFALSGDVIVSNGVFYSFDVTAEQTGEGEFTFDFADAFGLDANSGQIIGIATGAPLAYTVLAAPGDAVPEPVTLLCLMMAAGTQLRRRRRRQC
jgi:hypothetical protein